MTMTTHDQLRTLQTTRCPQCGTPAEITSRAVLESTDGPIEHASVHCVRRHHFLLPTEMLDRVGAEGSRPDPARLTTR